MATPAHGHQQSIVTGEIHAVDDVGNPEAASNQCRPFVDHAIPDLAGLIIASVPWLQQRALQMRFEFLDEGVLEDSGLEGRAGRRDHLLVCHDTSPFVSSRSALRLVGERPNVSGSAAGSRDAVPGRVACCWLGTPANVKNLSQSDTIFISAPACRYTRPISSREISCTAARTPSRGGETAIWVRPASSSAFSRSINSSRLPTRVHQRIASTVMNCRSSGRRK